MSRRVFFYQIFLRPFRSDCIRTSALGAAPSGICKCVTSFFCRNICKSRLFFVPLHSQRFPALCSIMYRPILGDQSFAWNKQRLLRFVLGTSESGNSRIILSRHCNNECLLVYVYTWLSLGLLYLYTAGFLIAILQNRACQSLEVRDTTSCPALFLP